VAVVFLWRFFTSLMVVTYYCTAFLYVGLPFIVLLLLVEQHLELSTSGVIKCLCLKFASRYLA